MDLLMIPCLLLLVSFHPSAATSLITDLFEARGQRVCKAGKGKPCYKLAYFSELRRKMNFAEAELACRREGGRLLSIRSASEQKVVEQLITELRPTDGDFWIGLRRNHGDEDSSSDCSSQYYWVDGSKSKFRNWHMDEPSCGYEVCVVMYHQPSAPAGQGGLYMFQWNDDNCETKNNFICKYAAEKPLEPTPPPNSSQTDVFFPSALPWDPQDHGQDKRTAVNLVYVIIPTIPLILLLLTVLGVCCFKLLVRRKRKEHKSEVCQTEPGLCPSPSTDVYNVIHSQKDDDLVSARPQTKNTSFLCSSPDTDTPTGDYDNLGARDTESGFVTLASTESGFLNFDLNELSLGRRGTRDFHDASLGRSGKRELLHDGSLGRSRNREFYDRSLGRRTTKSEHYGSGAYADHGLYDASVPAGGDLYDATLKPESQTGKVDLYQTYAANGKQDTFQTRLGTYTNRKSFHTNLDCYRNGLNFDSGRKYYHEHEWMNREKY
ncbi:layilin isoform X2 [Kryptolebias marmoratus]|uniref:layilin isoform X2 n=1 Tax=Kryptolebias marmoratus TaxID=37003 RepID=UPI000D52F31E|nr:layilin isoform X2 [Kryptolebias marmoratus]